MAENSPARDPRYIELRRKFHPLLMEMDNRRVRLDALEYRNGRLYVSAEAPSDDDLNYIWLEARSIDPDLVDLSMDLTVGRGNETGERAADRDIELTTERPPDRTWEAGDRRNQSGQG